VKTLVTTKLGVFIFIFTMNACVSAIGISSDHVEPEEIQLRWVRSVLSEEALDQLGNY
jgi:hypothetical protein